MIEKLTEAQEQMLEVYKDKWLAIGLSTEPCNVEETKKWVKVAYKNVDLKEPTNFYHAKGPSEALEIFKEITGSTSGFFSHSMYGSQEAGWLGYYEYFWKEVGIEECSIIEPLVNIAKNCGWWHAYEEFVLLQDRPQEIHMNEDAVLHNDNGPSVLYRDGFKVWSIDGYRVNEKIVMRPNELTVDEIHSESNADVQSIMVDRYGWENYIENIDAKLVDYRDNYIENTKEALYDCGTLGMRLLVTCPTGRVFTKGILPGITSCEAAQNWLGNDSEKTYNVIGRT
jgi:hypothetical protein